MTFEAAYIKIETLSPNAEELSPAPSNSEGVDDDTVRVKQETIFLPESMGVKEEEESAQDEEDKDDADVGAYQYENVSSPGSWSFRLLEVTHETDCADRAPPSLHRHAASPDRCGTPVPPGRGGDERDPFAMERVGDPLENAALHRSGKRPVERFVCAHCGKTFFSKYCITKHVFSHEPGVPVPPYICELCGGVFPDAGVLVRHVADRGCEDRDQGEGEGQEVGLDTSRTQLPPVCQIRPFACQTCGATFARLGHLKVHQAVHATDRPHACDVCGKRFRQSVHLTVHRRLHSGERPYGCEVCGKAFRQSAHLQVHRRQHTGYRPFGCDVCGRTYTDRTGLVKHKAVHTEDHHVRDSCDAGPFPCDKCGRAFADAFALKRHVRVHEGKKRKPCDVCGDGSPGGRECRHEKPYVCEVCGKAFARSSALKRHAAVHAVARTLECARCRRTFKWASGLSSHKCGPDAAAKQFSCDICGKLFRYRHNAATHRKVHTGESAHSCDVCGKLCDSASNLRSHCRVHSEERPYTCETCGGGFRRKGNLAAHRKTRHGGETRGGAPERASSPPGATPLPDGGGAFDGAPFYECTTCRSSFTDAISYWSHVRGHSSNDRTGAPDSCGGRDGSMDTAPSEKCGPIVLRHDTQPVNTAFSCESEMVIPVGPEIVNMYSVGSKSLPRCVD